MNPSITRGSRREMKIISPRLLCYIMDKGINALQEV